MRVEYMVDNASQVHVSYSSGNPVRAATVSVSRFGFAADEMLEINFRTLGELEKFCKEINTQFYRIKNEIIERAKTRRKGTVKR